jgi:hypothetical protein
MHGVRLGHVDGHGVRHGHWNGVRNGHADHLDDGRWSRLVDVDVFRDMAVVTLKRGAGETSMAAS